MGGSLYLYRSFYDNSNQYIKNDTVIYDPSNDLNANLTGSTYACSQSAKEFYSFDNNVSAANKGRIFLSRGFGGVMIYPFDGDLPPDSSGSIINALLRLQSPLPSATPSSTPSGSATASSSATSISTASSSVTSIATASSSFTRIAKVTASSSGSATASALASFLPPARDNSNKLAVGLGIGLGIGWPLLGAFILLMYCWKRKQVKPSANITAMVFQARTPEPARESTPLIGSSYNVYSF
jgi:hypothetical protein